MKKFILIGFLALLAACSSSYNTKYTKNTFGIENPPYVYTVQSKDSLFSIAWRYGLELEKIQKINNLSDPNKIFVGQKLRLRSSGNKSTATSKKPTSRTQASRTTQKKRSAPPTRANWVWPMRGAVVRGFNPKRIGANGIRIAGNPNQTVNAADSGVVAYKGNGLNGYGNVIIIKHNNGLLSAYGFLSKTYVREGQRIKKRQKIGTVGYASNRKLMLHFEVRRNGKPVNPKQYIGNSYRF